MHGCTSFDFQYMDGLHRHRIDIRFLKSVTADYCTQRYFSCVTAPANNHFLTRQSSDWLSWHAINQVTEHDHPLHQEASYDQHTLLGNCSDQELPRVVNVRLSTACGDTSSQASNRGVISLDESDSDLSLTHSVMQKQMWNVKITSHTSIH